MESVASHEIASFEEVSLTADTAQPIKLVRCRLVRIHKAKGTITLRASSISKSYTNLREGMTLDFHQIIDDGTFKIESTETETVVLVSSINRTVLDTFLADIGYGFNIPFPIASGKGMPLLMRGLSTGDGVPATSSNEVDLNVIWRDDKNQQNLATGDENQAVSVTLYNRNIIAFQITGISGGDILTAKGAVYSSLLGTYTNLPVYNYGDKSLYAANGQIAANGHYFCEVQGLDTFRVSVPATTGLVGTAVQFYYCASSHAR